MILSVAELTEQLKSLVESHFGEVAVEGEVSRPTYHSSGHLYFNLKDEASLIRCVMFRSDVASLPFRLEDGAKVIVFGRIGIYKPRGEYQLYAKKIEPSGLGALKLAFEQLKEKLKAEGLFDERFKQPLPKYIKRLVLVTSQTGAALQDMLRIIKQRWPLLEVIVVDTLVQGGEAAPMIADALRYADSLDADAIVLARGGGSLEDLWAFNEEVVARAIFEIKTPVVSAIGHEIDYLISDFVADLRAPTPSAAMEMILPDKEEELLRIDELQQRFMYRLEQIFYAKAELLEHLERSFAHASPMQRLEFVGREIAMLKSRFDEAMRMVYSSKKSQIPPLLTHLHSAISQKIKLSENEVQNLDQKLKMALEAKKLPPKSAQIVKDGVPVELADVEVGDEVELEDLAYKLKAKILSKDAL